jgi:monoamine oxidase
VPEKRQFSLTCFVNAKPGEAWSLFPEHERRTRVMDHVWEIYNCDGKVSKETVFSPIEIFEMQWSKEDWSEGAVCPVTMPGTLNESAEWMNRKVGHLHFVGTEFAKEWKGYMEGAVASGDEGAKEAIDALRDRARL